MILFGKRFLATILVAAAVSAIPCMAKASVLSDIGIIGAEADTSAIPVQGDGTKESPYLISSKEGLEYMALLAENGSTDGVYFELSQNIELNSHDSFEYVSGELASAADSAAKWKSIGSEAKPFEGSFDGKGYYITGLYCDGTDSISGLFGVLDGAEIKNVSLDFALIEAGAYAGAVAGKMCGESKISDCTVYGSVIGKQTLLAGVSGGIAGTVSERSTVSGCCVYGAVTGANAFSSNVGGIAGLNLGTIEKCSFGGRAFGVSMYYSANVGGIAGTNHNKIISCRSMGSVGAESNDVVNESNAGGIAGFSDGLISQCSNQSAITSYSASVSESVSTAGGIAGFVKNSDITGCENLGSVQGEQGVYAGGIAGITLVDENGEYKIYNCINNGTVKSDYGIAGGIAAKVSASGYVTSKNELISCVNTATVKGSGYGGVVGSVYSDGAKAAFTDCYYPSEIPDRAPQGSTPVADAGFMLGNAFDGLDESVWVFESGAYPYILFENGLAKTTSAIAAEPVQTIAVGSKPAAQGVGTMLLSKEITSGVYDVIVRFTGDESSFAPKPVIVSVTAFSGDDALTILELDTNDVQISGGKPSGSIRAKLYAAEADKKYLALASIFNNGVFENIIFNELTTSEGIFDAELALPNVASSEDASYTVKVIVVEDAQGFRPICEAKQQAIALQ